jgi:hypothetical protein
MQETMNPGGPYTYFVGWFPLKICVLQEALDALNKWQPNVIL